ncbi:MAG: J domain-containing protein [Candidatus Levybacteria bacterium]|nr:J domain-containing protein [Candidatus Levybacteria bacterium]
MEHPTAAPSIEKKQVQKDAPRAVRLAFQFARQNETLKGENSGLRATIESLQQQVADLKKQVGGLQTTKVNQQPRESPFAVLGVSTGATPEEIRKAFNNLALHTHSDKIKGALEKAGIPEPAYSAIVGLTEEKMKKINQAYQELKEMERV